VQSKCYCISSTNTNVKASLRKLHLHRWGRSSPKIAAQKMQFITKIISTLIPYHKKVHDTRNIHASLPPRKDRASRPPLPPICCLCWGRQGTGGEVGSRWGSRSSGRMPGTAGLGRGGRPSWAGSRPLARSGRKRVPARQC
jgi:hypothetical protein